jgi:hypothetical protein
MKNSERPKSQERYTNGNANNALRENFLDNDELVNIEPRDSNMKKSYTAAFGKLISDKLINTTLKSNFQKSLAKLNDNATKEVGFNELKNMIVKFNTQESLRIFISLLSIYYNNCTLAAKEFQVLLVGYIAAVFRENLVDPLDKQPNIIKTIVRLSEIIQIYLKESSIVVHKACSHSWRELYVNCMPKDDINGIVLIIVDPLISLIQTGSNKMSQVGAAVCLTDFISHLDEDNENNKKILDAIYVKVLILACVYIINLEK